MNKLLNDVSLVECGISQGQGPYYYPFIFTPTIHCAVHPIYQVLTLIKCPVTNKSLKSSIIDEGSVSDLETNEVK